MTAAHHENYAMRRHLDSVPPETHSGHCGPMSSVGEPRRHRCPENCQTGARDGFTGIHHRRTSVCAG